MKILLAVLFISFSSAFAYPPTGEFFDIPNRNIFQIGNEAQWAMPANSGMNNCFSYQINGGKTIQNIQGTMGTMTFGIDKYQHSQVLVSVWISPLQLQSNPDGHTSAMSQCKLTDETVFSDESILYSNGGFPLVAMIQKIAQENQTNYSFSYTNLNQTIPDNWYLNVFHAATTSSQTNAWIDSEIQATITFK